MNKIFLNALKTQTLWLNRWNVTKLLYYMKNWMKKWSSFRYETNVIFKILFLFWWRLMIFSVLGAFFFASNFFICALDIFIGFFSLLKLIIILWIYYKLLHRWINIHFLHKSVENKRYSLYIQWIIVVTSYIPTEETRAAKNCLQDILIRPRVQALNVKIFISFSIHSRKH